MTTEEQIKEIVNGLLWASHGHFYQEIQQTAHEAVAALMRLVEQSLENAQTDYELLALERADCLRKVKELQDAIHMQECYEGRGELSLAIKEQGKQVNLDRQIALIEALIADAQHVPEDIEGFGAALETLRWVQGLKGEASAA